MTADALPTAQINSGVVWALAIIGNTVYAGGSFTAARPAGSAPNANTVSRSNLLSFDLTTGALTSFSPTFNGIVKSLAASPDGSRLYVGGSFTQVNGQTRYNVAAFDTATGALSTAWKPAVGGSYVNAIVASGNRVYVGGLLGAGNGVTRKNLIAFDTGGNLLGWAPTTDLQVDAMVMNPSGSKLIVGGRFALVNGVSQRGLVALSPTDGSIQPWIAPTIVKNGWNQSPNSGKAGIYSLSTDGTSIFGTGWVYANVTVGNLEGAFSADPETGAINWLEDCHGDTYTTYSDTKYVYATGHPHDCESVGAEPQKAGAPGNMRNAIAFTAQAKGTLWRSPRVNSIYANWEGQPAPAVVHWFPDWATGTATGQGQAGWVMAGSGDYLVVGGEFPTVNGSTQQGLVRFTKPGKVTPRQGPRLSGSNWTPSLVSAVSGTMRVTIPGNWDRDGTDITYQVNRVGVAQPLYTTTMKSYFWAQPAVTFLDTGLTSGSSYTYQVTATDSAGNQVKSATATATANGSSTSNYLRQVLTDGAVLHWPLGDSGVAADVLTSNNYGLKGSGVSVAANGAVDNGVGSNFNGTSNGRIGSNLQVESLDGFSASIWFKTTSNAGGKLFGFGASQSGSSGTYDRHLYMSNDGRLNFGIFQDNTAKVVTSPGTYRNGAWHQAVVTSDANGATLYVDGVRVASDSSIIRGQYYLGYWRVGGDSTAGWPNRGSSDYFSGSLDEFSVYTYALSSSQVVAQYAAGTGIGVPTASFTQQVTDQTVNVDASASSAASGRSITSYSWDFGDGSSSETGKTASHEYGAGGAYPVTLTVTDSGGLTASTTKQVTIVGQHQPPTASFDATVNDLDVAVDASGSQASDGAALSYDWNWGDGTAHASGKTATHTYAEGTYTVTLTVTDSLGAQATATRSVSPSAPAEPPVNVVAEATFATDVTSGWGSALTGGTWVTTGSGFSVADGEGRISMAAGSTRTAKLNDTTGRDVRGDLVIGLDKVPQGGRVDVNYDLRSGSDGAYRVKARFLAGGQLSLMLARVVGTGESSLASKTIADYTFEAGDRLRLRFEVEGAGTGTDLRVKVWEQGQTEPSGWTLTASDSTATLQDGGSVGVSAYVQGAVTNATIGVAVDDLRVTTLD